MLILIMAVSAVGLIFYVVGAVTTAEMKADTGLISEIDQKSALLGLIWPLLVLYVVLRTFVGALNGLLAFFLIMFNVHYNKSKLYKKYIVGRMYKEKINDNQIVL